MAYYFDEDYDERALLRDGTEVQLRLVRASDKDHVRDGFERMSPESRYRRFFTAKRRLTDAELRYLTEIDNVNHVAIAALRQVDGKPQGLGVARFVRLEDRPEAAEAAIAVVDELHGRGLGSLLFQRLVAAARERGIEKMVSTVLGSNKPMLQILADMQLDTRRDVAEGIVTTEFDVPQLDPENPLDQPPRDNDGYRILTMAAKGLIELTKAFPAWFGDKQGGNTSAPAGDAGGSADGSEQ